MLVRWGSSRGSAATEAPGRLGGGSREGVWRRGKTAPQWGHISHYLEAVRKSWGGTGYQNQSNYEREMMQMNPKRNVTCEDQCPCLTAAVQLPFLKTGIKVVHTDLRLPQATSHQVTCSRERGRGHFTSQLNPITLQTSVLPPVQLEQSFQVSWAI